LKVPVFDIWLPEKEKNEKGKQKGYNPVNPLTSLHLGGRGLQQ
jgi:hypothetical protein